MANDIIKQTYDILFKHLEADSYGNNKYITKEKFQELLSDLTRHVSYSFKLGEASGKRYASNRISVLTDELFDALREECQQQNVKKDQ